MISFDEIRNLKNKTNYEKLNKEFIVKDETRKRIIIMSKKDIEKSQRKLFMMKYPDENDKDYSIFEIKRRLYKIINDNLSELESFVLCSRYGLYAYYPVSMKELSEDLNCSPLTIADIERKAIEELLEAND